jgi:hypothetical protein
MEMVSYAGTTGGTQTITVTIGDKSGSVSIELVAGTVYIDGDAFALANYMDFRPAKAAAEAGKWMSMNSTNPDFSAVASGLTVRSTMTQLAMEKLKPAVTAASVGGTEVTGIEGMSVASPGNPAYPVTLYVQANGDPLPVELVASSAGLTATMKFTRWDVPEVVSAPSDAVAFSSSWLATT